MKCPECQFKNPEGMKFCVECGKKLELLCAKCGSSNSPDFKYCGECGTAIEPEDKKPSSTAEHDSLPSPQSKATSIDGERKHATILFSDLSGYTAMSEKLDPEKVKDIMECIFTAAGEIADKYNATVEKFFGDEVMIIFGVPKAHEDDPVRAINVALKIHERVAEISTKFEKETRVDLQMHSGINTGLVVTGDKYIGKSRHGLTGDTINLAKRLTGLAVSGDIVVGPDTFSQSGGYFDFEALEPTDIKGKSQPVQAYRVISSKDQPRKIHRLQGVRAKLIGRKVEMDQLQEATERLREGRGTIFSIVGTAGTGKSRLVEEFKVSLNPEEIQWFEGHAYPFTQNIPYFPLINLLSRAFEIKEGDSTKKVKEKIETGVTYLMGEGQKATPYIGSLFSLSYPKIDEISPEFWKSKLQQSIQSILSALAKKGPTVICLEDLHWADPSFLELIHHILSDFREPVLFLCIYRPIVTLFPSHQTTSMANPFQKIRIQDFSTSESQDMLESLLNTENIPDELRRFVQAKVEGNPFYLEEMINSFIESKTLIRESGNWHVARSITAVDISASIHGVISARLDRLDLETKRILQQAAVIGRAFYYEILKKITDLKGNIDGCLSGLERLDLIKRRSIEPDLEYIFKHAITHEVVYNGLLNKERGIIHEQIGLVIERLFRNRLPEFYETLAFHFSHSQYPIKAVDYLLKAGEKSLRRYSVKEAHLYFQKAYDILAPKEDKSRDEKNLLIDILNNWGYAYYYLGEIKEFIDIFSSHQALAKSLDDKARAGMFYAWFGIAHYMAGKSKDSYDYLRQALVFGEKTGSQKVVGYACAWLTYACADIGFLNEGIGYGERAQKISGSFPSDQYLFFKSLSGICFINYYKGDTNQVFKGAKRLLEFGDRTANSRSKVFGHWINSLGHLATGNIHLSQKSSKKAIEAASDPFYAQLPKAALGLVLFFGGQLPEAENVLQSVINFSGKRGLGQISVACKCFLVSALFARGQMHQGTKLMENTRKTLTINQGKTFYALSEYILGKVNSQIATGQKPSLSIMVRNIGFLIKNVPSATRKAEDHFHKAIELFKQIGMKGYLGEAYLSLGQLYKATKRTGQARQCILEAIEIFEENGAEVYLKQANEALASL